MLNICDKMADNSNTCDSIAADPQIALFTMYASDGNDDDGRMLKLQE